MTYFSQEAMRDARKFIGADRGCAQQYRVPDLPTPLRANAPEARTRPEITLESADGISPWECRARQTTSTPLRLALKQSKAAGRRRKVIPADPENSRWRRSARQIEEIEMASTSAFARAKAKFGVQELPVYIFCSVAPQTPIQGAQLTELKRGLICII